MSKFLQPTQYNGRQQENNWINFNIHFHDSFCGCPEPLTHLQHLLNERCRHFKDATTTTETGGIQEKDEIGIDDGDLERLFATENEDDEG